ncbi:MAG TPA: GNAT family N-acetyltransferase [Clostridia bacterium]|nr:GNAT family N-acetyltransferase [Clostridia bacterium]
MKTVNLKDGRKITIRNASKSDAASMLKFIDIICRETAYLTFGEGEFQMSIEEEENLIESKSKTDNALFLVAEINDEIVGNLSFSAGMRKRLRHVGEFGVSVRGDHWGLGIGRALIEYLIDWAGTTGIVRKINLRVRTDNEKAIKLYKSLGFEVEGRLLRDLMIDNKFFDSYQMGLKLD